MYTKVKIMNYLLSLFRRNTGCIEPCGFTTVNAHYINYPKDSLYVQEIKKESIRLSALLSNTEVIKDTFKKEDI